MNQVESKKYSEIIVGQELLSVSKVDYTWVFNFSGKVGIATESFWRFIFQGHIRVSSDDDGEKFGLPQPLQAFDRVKSIIGQKAVAAIISPSSGDLIVEFGEESQIQFLQTSSGYESWRLTSPAGEAICVGGGKIVYYSKNKGA